MSNYSILGTNQVFNKDVGGMQLMNTTRPDMLDSGHADYDAEGHFHVSQDDGSWLIDQATKDSLEAAWAAM